MLQQHAHCAWATTIIKLIIFVAYGACWVCLCCRNPPNSDMDYRIFIVRPNITARHCTQGWSTHARDPALKVDSGRKISCRTGELNLRRRRAGPMHYQQSYISLVNWYFEPSQPLGIISGLKETFIKRYIVERTNKAEIRPEEQSQKTESCLENLWNEIRLGGP